MARAVPITQVLRIEPLTVDARRMLRPRLSPCTTHFLWREFLLTGGSQFIRQFGIPGVTGLLGT
jgi:hypothetical protein